MNDKQNMAYGSVYLDRGEGKEQIKEQIDSFLGKGVVGIGFDFIGKEKHEKKYNRLVPYFRKYASQKLNLKERSIVSFFLIAKNKGHDPRNDDIPSAKKAMTTGLKLQAIEKPSNNLELIEYVFSNEKLGGVINQAKKFLLNVEKAQSFYDSMLEKDRTLIDNKYFETPFDNCLFAFEEPLEITFYKDNTQNSVEYIKRKWIGFVSQKLHGAEDSGVEVGRAYRFHIITGTGFSDVRGGETYSSPLLVGFAWTPDRRDSLSVAHPQHRCQNSKFCAVGGSGILQDYTDKDKHKAWFCQDILMRDSLVETIMFIINKIHYSESTKVLKKKGNIDMTQTPNPKLWGWPFTKGNIPQEGYTQYLDGKRYVYDKDEIAHGTGAKHRFRYDVRRHPRIVGDKIVWVNPHQRGSGSYKSKVYSNRRTWFVQYLFYQAEKLTKYRMLEILVVRFIKFIRKIT